MKKKRLALTLSILLIFCMTMTTFADTKVINRVEFLKALLDLGNIEVQEVTTSSFRDVTNPEDIPFVETAVKQGIASGYNGFFHPTATITKEEALTMVVKSFGEVNVADMMTPELMAEHLTFEDKESISPWAKPYVAYGVMKGMMEGEGNFHPKSPLTLEGLKDMMTKAETVFTREGMTASEMLQKASDKLLEYKTMKYTLDMKMNSQVIDNTQEGQAVDMVMTMLMEGAMDQENNKVYIIGTTKTTAGDEAAEATTEIVMDDYVMYMKYPGSEKWLKQDLNPMMQDLQGLLGTNLQNTTGVSKQQMELFGMRATYLPEEVIDGETYYVILMTIDNEAFMKVMDEVLVKAVGVATEIMGPEASIQLEDEEMKQMMEAAIKEIINNMEMKVQYRYYIHQDTKVLDKMEVHQVIDMSMGILQQHAVSTGTFQYYGFDEAVEIPEVQPEEIMSLEEMMKETAADVAVPEEAL